MIEENAFCYAMTSTITVYLPFAICDILLGSVLYSSSVYLLDRQTTSCFGFSPPYTVLLYVAVSMSTRLNHSLQAVC
jgi:type III secretory pathway component EscR